MDIEQTIKTFQGEIAKRENLASLAELREEIMSIKSLRKPDRAYLSELCFVKRYELIKQSKAISKGIRESLYK